MTGTVIAVGGILWETTFYVDEIPGRGVKLLPREARQMASGMAVAAAATMARLSMAVELWGLLGNDANGHACRDNLVADGISVGLPDLQPTGRTPFSTVLIDPAGERLVVPYFDPALFAAPQRLPLERIAQAAAVLVDMRWMAGGEAVLRHARACGVPAVLDADLAPHADLQRLMKLADHVLLSEVALQSLCGAEPAESALRRIADTLPQAEIVGVTLGAEGALIWQKGRISQHPAPRIQAVDTLNAGDVWHGAYVYGLVAGMDVSQRMAFANTAAAIKCEREGARLGAPYLREVLARLSA